MRLAGGANVDLEVTGRLERIPDEQVCSARARSCLARPSLAPSGICSDAVNDTAVNRATRSGRSSVPEAPHVRLVQDLPFKRG